MCVRATNRTSERTQTNLRMCVLTHTRSDHGEVCVRVCMRSRMNRTNESALCARERDIFSCRQHRINYYLDANTLNAYTIHAE